MDRYTFDPYGDLRLVLCDPNNSESMIEEGEDGTTISNCIDMLASSKHMTLASPVFRAMLQAGHFLEGNTLASQREVEIPLPDDDAVAFEIILNILHSRTRRVPKCVDLALLTELAILVDKYQLHEAVEFFSDEWFNNFTRPTELQNSSPQILSLICITWVFNKPNYFAEITREAQMNCTTSLRGYLADQLPIPSQVLEDINHLRIKAIGNLIGWMQAYLITHRDDIQCNASNYSLDDAQPDYRNMNFVTDEEDYELEDEYGDDNHKPFFTRHRSQCTTMMRGYFDQIARKYGIEFASNSIYKGCALSELCGKLSDMEIYSLCDRMLEIYESFSEEITGIPCSHASTIKKNILFRVQAVRQSIVGLELENYRTKQVETRLAPSKSDLKW